MRAARIVLAAICALFLSVTAVVAFDPSQLDESERTLQKLRADLAQTNQKLFDPVLTDDELADFKASLEQIRTAAAENSAGFLAPLEDVTKQISSLGPPPGEGQAEDKAVAQARVDLGKSREALQSLKAQFDVVTVEAEQASGRVSALQREQFYERVFVRTHSIFSPTLWYNTWVGFGVMVSSLALLFKNWWEYVSVNAHPLGLLLIPVFILSVAIAYRLGDRWGRDFLHHYVRHTETIDDLARLWIVVRAMVVTVVGLVAIIVPIHLALEALGYLTPRMYMVWSALVTTIFLVLVHNVTARSIASPRFPELRIINLDNTSAVRFVVMVTLIAFVAVTSTQSGLVAEGIYLGIDYTIGQSAAAALVLLILMAITVHFLRNQGGLPNPSGRRMFFSWADKLTPLVWILIAVGFAALILGYLSLASYIAHQMVRTSMALTALFVLYYFLDAAVASVFDPESSVGTFIRQFTGFGERAIERIGLVCRTAVDLIFLVGGIPILVVIWTLTWVDFAALYNTFALGIQVGNLRVSPGIVLSVLLIFIGGVIATKIFNTWLHRRILSETRIDKGVQDSILKGASYTGYILAAGFALTAGGLNFSNLAIMAGALGVGIGFGLQAIVNNFVSGLIILAERPIRVGDWVALPDGEGVVRRINVRSTEIETFDACTIIIPNLSLVTGPVRNWTHSDNVGRVAVNVTVETGSDPEVVRTLLLEAARSCSRVLTAPSASVLLTQIGLNGLDFSLRVFVADIMDGSDVASELRFMVLRSFAENGVNIAQPVGLIMPK